MKVVPFPQPEGAPDDHELAEIESALAGETTGAAAESWRELRVDVRTLAPAISPEFEQQLRERIQARSTSAVPHPRPRRAQAHRAGLRGWLTTSSRSRGLALGGMVAATLVAGVLLAASWRGAGGGHSDAAFVPSSAGSSEASSASSSSGNHGASSVERALAPTTAVEESSAKGASPAGGSSASRVQQRAASLTLAPKPEDVQSVADQVTQLTLREGGFVQSSQVNRQSGTGGSAELRLSLPSARLTAALAALGRLAPTRAESQSLQDISDVYDAARSKLADAVAERQALLRALARATTQSQIESLHARIALAAAAVTRARTAFAAISRRGSNATVEVTVLGDAHAGPHRSTLSNGLHDALDVLKAVAVVLLVALAVLVPLALVLGLAALGWRSSRRRLRERALS